MSSITRCFMLLFVVLLTACIPIQPPAAAPTSGGDAAVPDSAAELAGEFALVQLIVDFPAGTWTPAHTHGGMLLVTVTGGELTVRDEQGAEQTYKTGESFTETPGAFLEIGNAGESLTSVATVALLPTGEKLTTVKEGISTDKIPPGPTLLYQGKLAANSVAAP